MAIIPRELLVDDDAVQVARILSQQRVEDLNVKVISIALEDAIKQSKGNISDSALDAFDEARDVVLKHSYNDISTHVANKRLESCAERIIANRGFVGSVISNVRNTITPMVAGVAGVASAAALRWSWYNFTSALQNIQTLAMTPAGAFTAANIVTKMKALLPEGSSWFEYLNLIRNPDVVESMVPTMTELQQKIESSSQASSNGFLGSILNTGGKLISSMGGVANTILGGTLSGQAEILQEDIRHAHAQTVNYAKQASGALQATQNIFGGWIAVLVIIFIVFAFMQLYRGCSKSKCREDFNKNATEFLMLRKENVRRGDEQGQIRYYQFKSKKSEKRSPKKSAKKVKRSPKKSAKKVKRSPKKSAKKAKRSPKKSAKKAKRSPKKSAKKAKRSPKKSVKKVKNRK